MVYIIFYIFKLNNEEYKIKDIILSGGDIIKLEDKYKQKNKKENDNNNGNEDSNNELMGIIGKNASEVAGQAVSTLGEKGLEYLVAKEAGKKIVEKTVRTVTVDAITVGAIKASANAVESSVKQVVFVSISNSVEKIAVDASKGLVEQGFKEGTKMAIQAAKESVIAVSKKGADTVIKYGTRESIKSVTESIVIQQGGKAWLINLGKAVPFIGAGLSAIMNTVSTAKIGHKLVTKLDEEFEKNKQRKVDILKGKVLGIYNIIEQLENLIKNK